MITKNDIQLLRSLQRKKKRDELDMFVVEGEKLVGEALLRKSEVSAVYCTNDSSLRSPLIKIVGQKDMDRMTHLTNSSNSLALLKKPRIELNLSQIAVQKVLVLDSIRDPGNLGTIMRAADWFGIKHLLVTPDTVDCFNSKVVQATMGAIFRIKVHYVDLSVLTKLKSINPNFKIFAAVMDGATSDELMKEVGPGALIIGNESNGVSKELLSYTDRRLTIKRRGGGESLNAATSAAILLNEWIRS